MRELTGKQVENGSATSVAGKDAAPTRAGEHRHGGAHHHHHDGAGSGSRRRLWLVLLLTATYMFAEAIGGWLTGSLALLADAGHMLTDVAALALALFATWFAQRPATAEKTYGYYRLEILAAFANGVTLVVVALVILREAYERLQSPPEVESGTMMLVATGGLAINIVCAWLLHGDHKHNLNVRGAWLHVIGDALGSVGAIIAALLMTFYGWYAADPVFGAAVSLLIIWSSWNLIRESTNVLLEGVPAHINVRHVEETLLDAHGVTDVHDLHVWTITSGRDALSAHVVHLPEVDATLLLRELRDKLHDQFHIDHLTIQMEAASNGAPVCGAGTVCFGSRGEVRG